MALQKTKAKHLLKQLAVGDWNEEIEEDDPFEEDLEEFKKGKLNFFTILQWLNLVLIVAALIVVLLLRI